MYSINSFTHSSDSCSVAIRIFNRTAVLTRNINDDDDDDDGCMRACIRSSSCDGYSVEGSAATATAVKAEAEKGSCS